MQCASALLYWVHKARIVLGDYFSKTKSHQVDTTHQAVATGMSNLSEIKQNFIGIEISQHTAGNLNLPTHGHRRTNKIGQLTIQSQEVVFDIVHKFPFRLLFQTAQMIFLDCHQR